MRAFSEKIFLQLAMPSEEAPAADAQQIRQGLRELGYENVTIPLQILQLLYPMCRDCGYAITVTLVYRETDWVVVAVEAGDCRQWHYGLAVDYGSTTLVMQLVDLNSGAVIDEAKAVNGQTRYGSDILTRITYSLEAPSHMDDLQRATAETFNGLLAQLTESSGIDAAQCAVMVVSGNTTMIHFLLKLNAWTVFAAPFAPVTTDPGWFRAEALGIGMAGFVYIIPAASNYVGGDIVSGLLRLGMHRQEEVSLFFDIGTNGELVIGNNEWLMAGAGAAGPALEGYISRYGMRAADGAIDTVAIEGGTLRFTTIGNKKPVGICGSGIIDLLAQMLLNGWINSAGEFDPKASDRIVWMEDQYAAVYATAEESALGQPLVFTQTDIRQYLDTKAAAYTMIECLLETAGCGAEDLAHCYLSGAFTAHSDLNAAITIGMFPDLPVEKYSGIANTSLEGARLLLLDRSLLQEAHQIAASMYCVQFASIPDFLVRMQAAKFLPHTDLKRFPNVSVRLRSKEPV